MSIDLERHVYVLEEEFRRLLNERVHLRNQVKELQGRGTELLLENRDLKARLSDAVDRGWLLGPP